MGNLVHHQPWLMPVLQAHLDDNDEVLPHLLLADIGRWLEARLRDFGEHDNQLRSVLEALETGFATGHPHVQELIAVSFLELLPRPDEPLAHLRTLIGPHLRQELERIS